jgi:dsDNA-binding SOS-regulon protein
LAKVEVILQDFISSVESHVLDSMDTELADSLVETLKNITDMLIHKQEKGLDISIWHKHNKAVFYMLVRAMGVYNNFKLINKAEPGHILE